MESPGDRELAFGDKLGVINTTTGELLRHLTLDPTKDYQPLGPKR